MLDKKHGGDRDHDNNPNTISPARGRGYEPFKGSTYDGSKDDIFYHFALGNERIS